jgi:hypothetical protein
MADRTLYMDRDHVARFDMPRVGPLVTDRYMVIRPDRCPGTPVPAERGWWRLRAGEFVSLSGGQALEEIPKLVRPSLPKIREPGTIVSPTRWLVRDNDVKRLVLMLLVGDRPVPVDVDAWDRWTAYLDATFPNAWQARQVGRNKPVTFWTGRTWLGLLLPVLDRYMPDSLPPFDYRAVPDPPSRRELSDEDHAIRATRESNRGGRLGRYQGAMAVGSAAATRSRGDVV